MPFFKKNTKLLGIIETQRNSINSLKSRVVDLESIADKTASGVRQNSEAILEIDDSIKADSILLNNAHDTLSSDFEKYSQGRCEYDTFIQDRLDHLLRMQRVIVTWIVILCSTSIFSFLLYYEII